MNYLSICDRVAPEDAVAAARGIREVLSGERERFALLYANQSGSEERWYMLRVTRFEGLGDVRALVAQEPITPPMAAHLRTVKASQELEKVNAALRSGEALEAHRSRILELIATNQVLDAVLREVALLVEHQVPGFRCAVALVRGDEVEIAHASGFSPEMRESLRGQIEGKISNSGAGTSEIRALMYAIDAARRPQVKFEFIEIPARAEGIQGWLSVTTPGGEAVNGAADILAKAASLAGIAIDHSSMHERLSSQAHYDSLTELPNRIQFHELLQRALDRSRRSGRGVAVLMIDLDHFEQVNNTYGDHVGNALLREVGHRLLSCAGGDGMVARLGGDEFVIILDNLQDRSEATQVARCIMSAMQSRFAVNGYDLGITCSLGLSVYPDDAADSAMLVRDAGIALSQAKQVRNTWRRFDASRGVSVERTEIERYLRDAVRNGELHLLYQPQLDLRGRVAGVEALLRWNSPALGMVPPDRFIPVAEQTGLIVGIGTWVLREACRQARQWQTLGFPVRMSVNVSTVELVRPDFAQTVSCILEETGLDSSLLELEITESAMMRNMHTAIGQMERVRDLGVRMSIDDFGTGYSSLSYIRRLPVHTVKIDRSFIRELGRSSRNADSVVQAIVLLAHGLNLRLVAEGVETETQLKCLVDLGCDLFQGYLFYKPVPADAVEDAIRTQHGSMKAITRWGAADCVPVV